MPAAVSDRRAAQLHLTEKLLTPAARILPAFCASTSVFQPVIRACLPWSVSAAHRSEDARSSERVAAPGPSGRPSAAWRDRSRAPWRCWTVRSSPHQDADKPIADVLGTYLGGDEDLIASDAGRHDSFGDLGLVLCEVSISWSSALLPCRTQRCRCVCARQFAYETGGAPIAGLKCPCDALPCVLRHVNASFVSARR